MPFRLHAGGRAAAARVGMPVERARRRPLFGGLVAVAFLVAAPEFVAAAAAEPWRFDAVDDEVPKFLDCTEEQHGDWARFRELWFAAPREAPSVIPGEPAFPQFELELANEAMRLHNKWAGQLAKWNEDYPPGAADFYHNCHFDERSPYCLYGHVAALTFLSRYLDKEHQRHELTRAALRLLGWNHCLDHLESSNWGFSVLDLWDRAGGYAYPQVSLLHQHLLIGEGFGTGVDADAASRPTATGKGEGEDSTVLWVFELGIHQALSNEPVSMFKSVLPGYTILHQNFVKAYEGRAEAYRHPFPRECSPNCKHQQESVPYTFPMFDDMPGSSRRFREWMLAVELSKPQVRASSIFLCTNPIYYCTFFAGLNQTTIGYFGLPLLYMVPREDWSQWTRDFVSMVNAPENLFLANNPLLAEQIAWQSGMRVRVVRPVALYLEASYYPRRIRDVLVPEPREACVLNCLLRRFTPVDYPLRFFEKADTDRSFRTFATFRSIVIFPHDYALMSFYEFYAMSIPLFLPSHLSNYLFPYSATVPMLDWVPQWLIEERSDDRTDQPPLSPLSLTSTAALRHWSKFFDFFIFPGVQLFPSIAALLQMLPAADVHAISARMRDYRLDQLMESSRVWGAAASRALRPSS